MVQGLKPWLNIFMKKLFVAIVLVVALSGCNKQKEIVLRDELESLRLEVAATKQMSSTLQQIGLMIDSVDVLRKELAQGKYRDNPDKLREINKYVASMQSRSSEIEKQLEKGTGSASVYNDIISRLTRDLATKTFEFNTLTEQVALHKGVNDTLRMLVEAQTAEIDAGATILAITKQEILRLDEDVKQLSVEARSMMTDSYDEQALGSALAEAAKRTHLAIEKAKGQ
jgi:hypothetical protein